MEIGYGQPLFRNLFVYHPEQPLLYTQPVFWMLFLFIIGGYSLFYRPGWLRNIYLFLISLFFYYKSGGAFVILLLSSCAGNYFNGLLIGCSRSIFFKRTFLVAGLVFNLGILVYYKYTYFFTGLVNKWFNAGIEVHDWIAEAGNQFPGGQYSIDRIILPVGISFFTFQAISYIVDIYKRKISPLKNPVDFSFYLSFFPQLIAGPIVRASEFIPQLKARYSLGYHEWSQAAFLILCGLVKKILISDYVSLNFVDRIFESPEAYTGLENLFGVYGYAIQIYCDFSGYTDIAIGLALLFGFRLPMNFYSPYKATSLSDFWRRWHISLSTWLRDYLYISLGGNRKGKFRTYINLMITMVLGGLWHGANMRFVIWGAIHGVGLILHKIWITIFPTKFPNYGWLRSLKVLFTFHVICLTWIFFRADNVDVARTMLNQIFFHFHEEVLMQFVTGYARPLALITLGFVMHWLPSTWKFNLKERFIVSPGWAKLAFTVIIIFVLYQISAAELQPFIYFQF